MAKTVTPTVEHPTALDVDINGVTMMAFTSDGVSRPNGRDADWHTYLAGDNFSVGGSGSVDQSVLAIGSFRTYNVWELVNSASSDPFTECNFWLPDDYDGSDIKVTLQCVRVDTASGTDIDTRVRLGCIGAGDDLDVTISSGVDVITTIGANDALFTIEHTVSPANAADGGLCHGFIQRVPTAVADDYTGSIYVLGAKVEYA